MFWWFFPGLCGVVFCAGIYRLVLVVARRAQVLDKRSLLPDGLLFLSLVPVALWSVAPYVSTNLVGSGDAYHYALQAADFVTQARAGVMPVFVGQSMFGFNGNIHTLRTAPYYTHLAGLLDILSGQRLSFVTLQNLTVIVTAVLAAWAAFGASLVITGRRRLASWLLATIYVFSPAVIGPLVLNDMFATYMAAPWLMLCWSGLFGILSNEDDLLPQFVAAGALALTWFAHSPIAAWLSLVWAAVQIIKVVLNGGRIAHWIRLVPTALVLVGLLSYSFASITSIGENGTTLASHGDFEFYGSDLQKFLRTEFSPFHTSLPDASIQLGWTFWGLLVVAIGLTAWLRQTVTILLLMIVGVLLAILVPVPHLSDFLWQRLPSRVVQMTTWPSQRLCPIIAAGILVSFAALLQATSRRLHQIYWSFCTVLFVGCVWSAFEVNAVNRRPGLAQLSPTIHQAFFARENIHLTRSAYDWLGELPAYFTHGWADPEFESRVLDANLEVKESNALAIVAQDESGPLVPLEGSAKLQLQGRAEYLLTFAFTDTKSAGEISIDGGGIQRHYSLPRSGNALAFGSEPNCEKSIPIRLTQAGLQSVTILSNIPGVSFRVRPIRRALLPLQLEQQIPYSMLVTTSAPGFLETPRMYQSGYVAKVDGVTSPVRRSPNGLAMIAIPAGNSHVTLSYPGSIFLRTAWLLSLACFASFPWLLASVVNKAPLTAIDAPLSWIRTNNIFSGILRCYLQHRRRLFISLVAGSLTAGLIAGVWQLLRVYRSYGPVRITFELTKHNLSLPEPLLTLGKTGAADCIYIRYDDSQTARFGLDHWAYGGPLSAPVHLARSQTHVLEIEMGGLCSASRWFGRSDPALKEKPGFAPLILKLDGNVILNQTVPFYTVGLSDIYVGANPTGSSVTSRRFSGAILKVERISPTSAH